MLLVGNRDNGIYFYQDMYLLYLRESATKKTQDKAQDNPPSRDQHRDAPRALSYPEVFRQAASPRFQSVRIVRRISHGQGCYELLLIYCHEYHPSAKGKGQDAYMLLYVRT